MGLIGRLPKQHSMLEFLSAARQRFEEAKRAAIAGDRLVGVYLSGYAAEMLLKVAYFRLVGKEPSDLIAVKEMNEAKAKANTLFGIGWKENLHDLSRWAELLIEERKFRNVPYRPAFRRRLNVQVDSLRKNWREDLRYRVNRPRQDEVTKVVEVVNWLFANLADL